MCEEIIKLALWEDLKPDGDISSMFLPGLKKNIKAKIIAKADGVSACLHLVKKILDAYQKILEQNFKITIAQPAQVKIYKQDGETFAPGDLLVEISASAILVLGAERSILNFLQRLCGVASASKKLNDLIKDYPCKLLDTRKTMPGLRALEKEAFRAGGGTNHRFNLSDMVMLKENHLAVAGLELSAGVRSIRDAIGPHKKIEVEINADNLCKLDNILQEQVDIIMLDNFSPAQLIPIIKHIRKTSSQTLIEASGGINAGNLIDYARAGLDFISTGSVFTQASNIDISMLVETVG